MLTVWVLTVGGLMALALLLGAGCMLPWEPPDGPSSASAGTTLPATVDQRALVRRYIDLIGAEQYPEAWELLAPRRQRREPIDRFTSGRRALGHLSPNPNGGPFIWPAAVDEVRADVWLRRSDTSSGIERVAFKLERVGGTWRIADERGWDRHERDVAPPPPPARSIGELARRYVVGSYGPRWLPTLDLLHQEPFAEGRAVVFRVLNPLLDRHPAPRPTTILLFARRHGGGWEMAGGGAIGTVAVMDEHAVSCAWTWLRWVAGEPTTAAFYCTVEDPSVAAIELVRVDGGVQRATVAGQRAAVFPYHRDGRAAWPTQQPRAIRLFDADGRPLDLPTSSVIDGER